MGDAEYGSDIESSYNIIDKDAVDSIQPACMETKVLGHSQLLTS